MSEYTLEKAFEKLTELNLSPLQKKLSTEEIAAREHALEVQFPQSYREFLKQYGTLVYEDLVIFGLGVPPQLLPSVECAVNTARALHADMPRSLIPFHAIEKGAFACIDSQTERIVLWIANIPTEKQNWTQLAPSFEEYVYRIAAKRVWEEKGLEVLKDRVNKYQSEHNYDHAVGGTLPRNDEWRPYRYCIQDVLFGTCVVRHMRDANCLQVDVFLTAEIPEYGPLAGALALISFLLSEAYKCGGTMEIRFTNNVEEGYVPLELRELASKYSVGIGQADPKRISSMEAKALYAALTDFSPPLQEAINDLEAQGRAKMARACYVVHHGVWSKEQVEMIVLGSERPDSILGGLTQPQQWHLYQHDLLHARAALLAGMFERLLVKRVHQQGDVDFDWEDDVRPINITFDGDLYAKRYFSEDEVPLPAGWLLGVDQERSLPERTPFHVLIRARDPADLQQHLDHDLEQAAAHHRDTGEPTFVLIPADFHILPEEEKQRLSITAERARVGLLISPDTVLTFDTEAASKLANSRVLRK